MLHNYIDGHAVFSVGGDMKEVIERACTVNRSELKVTKSACRFASVCDIVCDIGTYETLRIENIKIQKGHLLRS